MRAVVNCKPDEGSAYTEYGPWEPSRSDRKSYAYCRDKYDRLTSNGYEIGRPSDSAPGR
ncbi:hypothetical protein ABZ719_18545 [Streptomyces sp. NPDC006743]|uniref:hypothetical protein n=1 Tax=Streptomyces sp. NPDC006743 TaxID=3154480 RepID=UPI003455E6EF